MRAAARTDLGELERLPENWCQVEALYSFLPKDKADQVVKLRLASGRWLPDSQEPKNDAARWFFYPKKTGYRSFSTPDAGGGAGGAEEEEVEAEDGAEAAEEEGGAEAAEEERGAEEEAGEEDDAQEAEEEAQEEGGAEEEAGEQDGAEEAEEEEEEEEEAAADTEGESDSEGESKPEGASLAEAAASLLGLAGSPGKAQRGKKKNDCVVPPVRRPPCVDAVARSLREQPPPPVGPQAEVRLPAGRPKNKRRAPPEAAEEPARAPDQPELPEEPAPEALGTQPKRRKTEHDQLKLTALEEEVSVVAPRPPDCRGGTSYTLKAVNGAKIQILLKGRGAFYLQKCGPGLAFPEKRIVSWSSFGGVRAAWQHALSSTGFDELDASPQG